MTPSPRKPLHEVQMPARSVHADGLKHVTPSITPDETRPERTLALKAILKKQRHVEKPFAEITSLCETAGATVVDTIAQNLERPHAATYLGKGKIEEAAAIAGDHDVDLIVADNDLSPAQERNLEKIFQRKVVDRSQLIMDIFARRASTTQAKLQVELAQLRYTYPRLKRMWTHLERYEGGIGMRGPGEKQLEMDKRIIQRRIQSLQARLDAIERRQEVTMRRRPSDFVLALVGYTNVGKSTLLNRLTGSEEFVENRLFATLDTRTRKWRIDHNRHVLLKDTVGFIRDLPHHLVASFHATLAETRQADILLHVVDASSPEAAEQIRSVEEVLRKIECGDKPTWMVLNKWDRVPSDRQVEARQLGQRDTAPRPVFPVSAVTGVGLGDLQEAVGEHLDRSNTRLRVVLPLERGDLFAFVQRHGKVYGQVADDDALHLDVELAPEALARLRAMCPGAVNGATEGRDGKGPEAES